MLFKKRHLELKFVKTPENQTNSPVIAIPTEEITTLVNDLGKKVVVTYVVVFGASVALYALGQMAVIAFEHNLND